MARCRSPCSTTARWFRRVARPASAFARVPSAAPRRRRPVGQQLLEDARAARRSSGVREIRAKCTKRAASPLHAWHASAFSRLRGVSQRGIRIAPGGAAASAALTDSGLTSSRPADASVVHAASETARRWRCPRARRSWPAPCFFDLVDAQDRDAAAGSVRFTPAEFALDTLLGGSSTTRGRARLNTSSSTSMNRTGSPWLTLRA